MTLDDLRERARDFTSTILRSKRGVLCASGIGGFALLLLLWTLLAGGRRENDFRDTLKGEWVNETNTLSMIFERDTVLLIGAQSPGKVPYSADPTMRHVAFQFPESDIQIQATLTEGDILELLHSEYPNHVELFHRRRQEQERR